MYSMPMFLTFFFLMIFPFPGNERTGTNTSLIQHDVMPIKPAPGAAGRNGQHPKPYSVLICPLFLVKHEFGMVAFCRGTAKLLSTILIIFFYPFMSVGYMGFVLTYLRCIVNILFARPKGIEGGNCEKE